MAKQTIPGTGISFQPGGLHQTTGTPQGQPIPAAKMQAALAGKYGPKGAKQARLAQTMRGFSHKKKRSNLAKAAGSGMSGTSY
jgi:hypothetical protein